MSSNAWSWLPEGALSSPESLARLDNAVVNWSSRWFRDYRPVRQRLQYADAAASPPAVASSPRITVRAMPAAVDVLAGHALDADLSRLEKGDADQAIIDVLSDTMLRDLVAELEKAFGGDEAAAASADTSGGVLVELTDGEGRRALILETSRAVLANARLHALPKRTRRGEPLTAIRTALADIPVVLSAQVGSATISLPEARRLAVGDVIVLDRALDQPVDLLSASDGAVVACARLADTASPRSLRLEAAAGRDRR